ncbi:hypothetical protein RHSIM_Rhsim01G0003300 [Rhododendron simsii]|uniref:Uncharacterized protein n=1 Tax=Rhododendron simsii TaxID=118357 RepID=A0A834HHR2_RHOSS|nr:hypothetical protein RHSIM_Rhsim01G0003300 [Rhododendron simsii]
MHLACLGAKERGSALKRPWHPEEEWENEVFRFSMGQEEWENEASYEMPSYFKIVTVLEGFRNNMIANFCPLFQLRFDSKELGKKLFYRDEMEEERTSRVAPNGRSKRRRVPSNQTKKGPLGCSQWSQQVEESFNKSDCVHSDLYINLEVSSGSMDKVDIKNAEDREPTLYCRWISRMLKTETENMGPNGNVM